MSRDRMHLSGLGPDCSHSSFPSFLNFLGPGCLSRGCEKWSHSLFQGLYCLFDRVGYRWLQKGPRKARVSSLPQSPRKLWERLLVWPSRIRARLRERMPGLGRGVVRGTRK